MPPQPASPRVPGQRKGEGGRKRRVKAGEAGRVLILWIGTRGGERREEVGKGTTEKRPVALVGGKQHIVSSDHQ